MIESLVNSRGETRSPKQLDIRPPPFAVDTKAGRIAQDQPWQINYTVKFGRCYWKFMSHLRARQVGDDVAMLDLWLVRCRRPRNGDDRVTPEERAALFERTANYRHGYDDGKSAGVWIGRAQGLSIAAALAAILAVAWYFF